MWIGLAFLCGALIGGRIGVVNTYVTGEEISHVQEVCKHGVEKVHDKNHYKCKERPE